MLIKDIALRTKMLLIFFAIALAYTKCGVNLFLLNVKHFVSSRFNLSV